MIRDLLQESYNAMLHNRRRTALTMLGMAWGIATVVMLLAYGDGFGRAIVNIFAEFGTKLFIVFPGRSTMQAGGQKAERRFALPLTTSTCSRPISRRSPTSRPVATKTRSCSSTTARTP